MGRLGKLIGPVLLVVGAGFQLTASVVGTKILGSALLLAGLLVLLLTFGRRSAPRTLGSPGIRAGLVLIFAACAAPFLIPALGWEDERNLWIVYGAIAVFVIGAAVFLAGLLRAVLTRRPQPRPWCMGNADMQTHCRGAGPD